MKQLIFLLLILLAACEPKIEQTIKLGTYEELEYLDNVEFWWGFTKDGYILKTQIKKINYESIIRGNYNYIDSMKCIEYNKALKQIPKWEQKITILNN